MQDTLVISRPQDDYTTSFKIQPSHFSSEYTPFLVSKLLGRKIDHVYDLNSYLIDYVEDELSDPNSPVYDEEVARRAIMSYRLESTPWN